MPDREETPLKKGQLINDELMQMFEQYLEKNYDQPVAKQLLDELVHKV